MSGNQTARKKREVVDQTSVSVFLCAGMFACVFHSNNAVVHQPWGCCLRLCKSETFPAKLKHLSIIYSVNLGIVLTRGCVQTLIASLGGCLCLQVRPGLRAASQRVRIGLLYAKTFLHRTTPKQGMSHSIPLVSCQRNRCNYPPGNCKHVWSRPQCQKAAAMTNCVQTRVENNHVNPRAPESSNFFLCAHKPVCDLTSLICWLKD